MNKNLRKAVIAGNWKMNNNIADTKKLISELKPACENADCDVVICVPYTDLHTAVTETENTNIKVGSQNIHWADNGAFTGEISASMLKEIGVEYAVIGHSERRQFFGEADETVNKRTLQAIKNGLTAILCVGEQLEQREKGITEEICAMQTKVALQGVSEDELSQIIIAYEPVWAIGTGVTATAEQAEEVCKFIRGVIKKLYSSDAADKIVIQYGGSMNAANAKELLNMENVDGGLIGGASLKAEDFGAIINAASN